jgi:trehalose 6-phosphate synthase
VLAAPVTTLAGMDEAGTVDAPLLLVANRLPLVRQRGVWRPASGGLVTALTPVVERVGGSWVGWDEDAQGVPARVDGLNVDLHAVDLDPELVEGYYHGFTNRTLWPLFHDLVVQPVIDRSWWRSYETVTRRFADKVSEVIAASPARPTVWIQDYHLLLLPHLLRDRFPDLRIGMFLHIPFPAPELFARLPWRESLLGGMLAADSLGFHTTQYRDNFLRTVQRIIPDATVLGDSITREDGRRVRALSHPISIDAEDFSTLARDAATDVEVESLREQFAGRKVLLGVDRLDYTKGIRHRLQAIELLLEQRPHLRGRFVFVQIAVPSRDDVEEYRRLRTQVETEVGRINGRFTEPGHDVPVHYLHRSIDRTRLAAYYRIADVMCVTPLKDGMNLVAKEFVTVRDATDGDGVLVLSEFCGTAHEFGHDAIRCNPFDVEGLAMLMERALELEPEDRRDRIARMAQVVRDHDVFRWVDDELSAITGEDHPA